MEDRYSVILVFRHIEYLVPNIPSYVHVMSICMSNGWGWNMEWKKIEMEDGMEWIMKILPFNLKSEFS